MKTFSGVVAVGVLSLLMQTNAWAGWTIDFEADGNGADIVHGQRIDGEYGSGSRFSGDFAGAPPIHFSVEARNLSSGPDYAVAFDTRRSPTRDSDLEAPFSPGPGVGGPANPGNILIIQENSYGCSDGVCNYPDDEGSRPAGSFTFTFSEAVIIESIDFFDIETSGEPGSIDFYAELLPGTFVSTGDEIIPTTGNHKWTQSVYDPTTSYNVVGVTRIVFNMGGSGGIDNLKFSRFQGGPGPQGSVPEPGTMATFGVGLAALAWVRRRRRA